MQQELISVREFSRRLGCSDVAIHKAIKAGKIVKGVTKDKKGWPLIIPDVAIIEWGKNYDPNYTSNENLKTQLHTEKKQPEQIGATEAGSMAAAKRAQAIFKAKILEIELKEKQSKLVDKKQVYMALFEAGKEVKSSIMSVPDRIIDAVFSAKSRNEAHTILTKALIEALETVADIQNKTLSDK
jgi:hypothetical protein